MPKILGIHTLPLIPLIAAEIGLAPRPLLPIWLRATIFTYLIVCFGYQKLTAKKPKYPSLTLVSTLAISVATLALIFAYFPINSDSSGVDTDIVSYNHIAKNLIEYRIYGEEFDSSTGELKSTAYRPPGYPAFLAAIYKLTGGFDYRRVVVVQFLIFLGSIVVLWKLIQRFFDGKIADLAIVFYGANLPLLFIANTLYTESLAQSLLIFFLYLYFVKIRGNPSVKSSAVTVAILTGLLGGWSLLIRPVYIIYTPLLALDLLLSLKNLPKIRFKKPAPATIIMVTVVALLSGGWCLRNSILAGRPTLIATNGGINIFIGHNPANFNGRSAYWPPQNYVQGILGKDLSNTDIPQIHRNIGVGSVTEEKENDTRFTIGAIKWAAKNPIRTVRLAINKIQFLLSPHYTGFFAGRENLNVLRTDQRAFLILFQTLYFMVFLLAAIWGAFNRHAVPILLLSIPYIFMAVLTFPEIRFQLPLYIPMAIAAGLGIDRSCAIIWRQRNKLVAALTLAIFGAQLFFSKNAILEPWHRFWFEREKVALASATASSDSLVLIENERHGEENRFVAKKYTTYPNKDKEYAYLEYNGEKLSTEDLQKLITEQPIYTSDITISEGLPKGMKDSFILVHTGGDQAIFELRPAVGLAGHERKIIAEHLFSYWLNQEQRVHTGVADQGEKYIGMELTISKNSTIKVIGKETLTFNSWPTYFPTIEKAQVYFPAEFFRNGIEIRITKRPYPNRPVETSIDTLNRDTWGGVTAEVRNLTTIY